MNRTLISFAAASVALTGIAAVNPGQAAKPSAPRTTFAPSAAAARADRAFELAFRRELNAQGTATRPASGPTASARIAPAPETAKAHPTATTAGTTRPAATTASTNTAATSQPQAPASNGSSPTGAASTWRELTLLTLDQPVGVGVNLPNVEVSTRPNGDNYDIAVKLDGRTTKDAQVQTNFCIVQVDGSCVGIDARNLPARALSVALGQLALVNARVKLSVKLGYYAESNLCPASVDGGCLPGAVVRISKPILMIDTDETVNGISAGAHHTIQVPLL
jgi:hypothetical protein